MTALAIPTGWKLVPLKPTVAMSEAWRDESSYALSTFTQRYQAMLAAAPKAPALQPLTDEQIEREWYACNVFGLQEFKHAVRFAERAHGIAPAPYQPGVWYQGLNEAGEVCALAKWNGQTFENSESDDVGMSKYATIRPVRG